MKILLNIKKLKKKLSTKKNFILFYDNLFKKIKREDTHIKSFISLNEKINYKKKNLVLKNIPVAIKDLIHFKGLCCTRGSLIFKNKISIKNAKLVDRLIKAGAQIIGKNNLVEFAYGSWGTNEFYGTVVNPKDQKKNRVCGGSSSGSAASVAAGFASVAIGTDTGGSIRVPAAYCGVLGLKTSHGRVPLHGVEKLSKDFDTVGIFGNYIEDVDKTFKVISNNYNYKNHKNFNLLYLSDNFYRDFSNEVITEYKKFLNVLSNSHYFLNKLELKEQNNFFVKKTTSMISYQGYQLLKKFLYGSKHRINKDVKRRLLIGKKINLKVFIKLKKQRKNYIKYFNNILKDKIIIAPVTKTTAPEFSQIDQNILPSEYCRFVNYLDLCAITFVIKMKNMPISIQAIARKGNDEMCIQFVKELKAKQILNFH